MEAKRTQWFIELRATFVAFLLAGALLAVSISSEPDTFERIAHALEGFEADEIILCVAILGVGALIDTFRMRRRKRDDIDHARMEVFRATMSTVHDLVNNALNSMQLLRFEAGDSKALSPESLALFDAIVQTTARQLTLLGSVEQIVLHKRAGGQEAVDYASSDDRETLP